MKKVVVVFAAALLAGSQVNPAFAREKILLVPKEPVGRIEVQYLSEKNPTGEELTAVPMQGCDRFVGETKAGENHFVAFKIPGTNSYDINAELPPGSFYVFTGKRVIGFLLTPKSLQYCFPFARIEDVPSPEAALERIIASPPDSVSEWREGRDYWMLGLADALPLRVWSDGVGGLAMVPKVTLLEFRDGVLNIEADSAGEPTVVVRFRIDLEKGKLIHSVVDGVDVTGTGWTGVW